MTTITVLGGTGYTGGHVVEEASRRGLDVRAVSRSTPESPVEGVEYRSVSLVDESARAAAVEGTDVIVAALSPRGDLAQGLPDIYLDLAGKAAAAGVRFGVVGGFSSLRPEAGAPRFAEGDDVPPAFADEVRTMNGVLEWLQNEAPAELDWFFVSPAQAYGSYAPGEKKGAYRTGGDVALFDADGSSAVSGADFATAILDEVESPAHTKAHFSVAY
ncbi:NAD(P)-dependent oxidoreductase [Herbiconiux sp. L3-i23]|uniref:NAD(P)-dependent oxidoreductase n=1 Tax=Herbiconiux sp. L3-i23 TaxID=2905871 RepID=UPI0020662E3B|nr:NAD(P)H-binding protein [Herbiconiux sp. L3-i23]BDI21482.1 NAD-dependent epimerase [Herbiconiux sp. L3-i23]